MLFSKKFKHTTESKLMNSHIFYKHISLHSTSYQCFCIWFPVRCWATSVIAYLLLWAPPALMVYVQTYTFSFILTHWILIFNLATRLSLAIWRCWLEGGGCNIFLRTLKRDFPVRKTGIPQNETSTHVNKNFLTDDMQPALITFLMWPPALKFRKLNKQLSTFNKQCYTSNK